MKDAYKKLRNSEIVDADDMGDLVVEALATVKLLVFGSPLHNTHDNALVRLSAVWAGDLNDFLGSFEFLLNFANLFDGDDIIFNLHV